MSIPQVPQLWSDFFQLVTTIGLSSSNSELTAGFKQDHEMENEILGELFNKSSYDPGQRPPINASLNAFHIGTTVRINHMEKETEDGIVRAHGIMIFSWEDSRIRWNATGKRAGLSVITREYHRLFSPPYCPPIAVIQTKSTRLLDIKRFRIDISIGNDGKMKARIKFSVFMPCDHDYYAFPLDKFRCFLSLVILEPDHTTDLMLDQITNVGSTFYGFKESIRYVLRGTLSNEELPMFIETGNNTTAPDVRSVLFVVFTYARRAERFFYLMTLPILCLLFLSASVAQLNSMYSLHLQIFCFSSILLHILYVKDELPPTAFGTPLIGYVYFLVVFSSLLFFALRAILLYMREKKKKIEFVLPRINITLSVDSIIDWTLFGYAVMVFVLSAYLLLCKRAFAGSSKYTLFS